VILEVGVECPRSTKVGRILDTKVGRILDTKVGRILDTKVGRILAQRLGEYFLQQYVHRVMFGNFKTFVYLSYIG
jgi:hypothetical protein